MDVSVSCGVSVSKSIDSPHELKQSSINHKQCTCTNGDSSVAELGNALGEVLHIQDTQLSGYIPLSDRNEIVHLENKMSGEMEIHQAETSIAKSQKGLTKCATFPCYRKTLSCDASGDGRAEIPGTTLESGNPCCMRSISLPTPLKLVSAMKGGREKQGTPLKKLTVTWAPDVYDPPAMSLSHTVKSHNQQRPRSNKRNNKHKHKGKSSRGSSGDKKQYRRNVANSDPHSKSTSDRLLLGGFNQSTMELVDFAVTDQDSKCGSSFLRTSLAKVHISVAEAT